eukprot:gene9194-12400_t
MRNLVILQDQVHKFYFETSFGRITCQTYRNSSAELYILYSNGYVLQTNATESTFSVLSYLCLNVDGSVDDDGWFDISFSSLTNMLVCISHNGSIATLRINDESQKLSADGYELIGAIDNGISSAKWSPDGSCLAIITNNNSIILMTSSFDVLEEIPMTPKIPSSVSAISWRGDGALLTVLSNDEDDGIVKVRIYNKSLELVSTGRNVADGVGSVMRGIGHVVAFATNGSHVAVSQEKVKSKLQIALLERNGLRHGDFDIKLPVIHVTSDSKWEVCGLEWDLPSIVLAVALKCGNVGALQLYYRNNYHWYLKSEWIAPNLKFLGFDGEISNRLYISQTFSCDEVACVRIVDYTWDTVSSCSSDNSILVLDGMRMMFTPVGKSAVPPPMCLYEISSSPYICRNPYFWKTLKSGSNWALVSLLNDDGKFMVMYGDEKGKPIQSSPFVVDYRLIKKFSSSDEEKNHGKICSSNKDTIFKSVIGFEVDAVNDIAQIIIVGSTIATHKINENDSIPSICYDVLIIMQLKLTILWDVSDGIELLTIREVHCNRSVGSIRRIVGSLSNYDDMIDTIGIGLANSSTSSFEVIQISTTAIMESKECTSLIETFIETDNILSLPEICTHISIISHSTKPSSLHLTTEATKSILLCLSARNRLYCNDVLLVAGASSYVYNPSFGMLLYVTVGSRPHLHFCSFDALFSLDSFLSVDQQIRPDYAEPRPLERGARVLASVLHNPKVVIQLPRGNLEIFEPRPLLIITSSRLLDEKRILDCLILLRRQRIDLNFLVDYNPDLFISCLNDFISSVKNAKQADLLSLFITSVEQNNVVLTKYGAPTAAYSTNSDYIKNKVNAILLLMRQSMLSKLYVSNEYDISLLNPILCSFAKQQPPLILDAIALVKQIHQHQIQTQTNRNDATSFLHNSLKYLSFLVQGEDLLNVALGDCDFAIARLVARLCGMDPKVYLPLIERFENISKGFDIKSIQYALMRCKVYLHLNQYSNAAQWGMILLERSLKSSSTSESLEDEVIQTAKEFVQIVSSHRLYDSTLPIITTILIDQSSVSAEQKNQKLLSRITEQVFNRIRSSYALYCSEQLLYEEAMAAWLLMHPPNVFEALKIARKLRIWERALSLCGKFFNDSRYPTCYRHPDLDPHFVAQSIIAEFKEQLQQGDMDIGQNNSIAITGGGIRLFEFTDHHNSTFSDSDKVAEVAKLCLDRCDDVEGAVEILLVCERFLTAFEVSVRSQRSDLQQEVVTACRGAIKELIDNFDKNLHHMSKLISEIKEMWENPLDRLDKMSAVDNDLLGDLIGQEAFLNKQRQLSGEEENDNKSEFSQISKYSNVSYRSTASRSSVMTGTSTLSILSTSSSQSALSQASSFSIEGLEHSLLSKGKASSGPISGNKSRTGQTKKAYKRDQSDKRIKKKEKSRLRAVKDSFNIAHECQLCEELYEYILQLPSSINKIKSINQLLLHHTGTTNTSQYESDCILMTRLQSSFDYYIESIQKLVPQLPFAPGYPFEWLMKKNMMIIMCFQEKIIPTPGNNNLPCLPNKTSEELQFMFYRRKWSFSIDEAMKLWKSNRQIIFEQKLIENDVK